VNKYQETEHQLSTEIFDLVDTEGNLLNLRVKDMRKKYASTLIKPQNVYILIDVQRFPGTPMLK